MSGLASIIIVTYNHAKYIESCLDSITKQTYPYEIIVVDNGSHDKTVQLSRNHSKVTVIETHTNLGYGQGNNLGAKLAQGDYLVFLNPDTIVGNEWLTELISPLDKKNNLITTPKILTYDGKKINTCGNINHFTGLTFTRGYGANPSDYNSIEQVSGFSGCCFAIRKENFKKLGGFDDAFFLYNEDSDLSWRANLKGYIILFIPTSIMYHDYVLAINSNKLFNLEKGRYLIIKKYHKSSNIVKLFPSFILTELFTFTYSASLGYSAIRSKLNAFIIGVSTHVEKNKCGTKKMLISLNITIPIDQPTYSKIDVLIKKIANMIYRINYILLKAQ